MARDGGEDARLKELYAGHVAALRAATDAALAASGFDALVIHAGSPLSYFSDDQEAPFRTNPAFAHFVPVTGPEHLLYIHAGKKPLLVRVTPEDYWYEHAVSHGFWEGEFDVHEATSRESAWKEIPSGGKVAFIGSPAAARNIPTEAVNHSLIISHLDWRRSFKTEYEIACIEEANHRAGHAHEAAREEFFSGASELGIHYAYVDELGVVDRDLPYETVVALDEKAAILHYQNKRDMEKGKVLLLDAGTTYLGYASDVTRTSVFEEECDFLFRGLLGGMEDIQQELCRQAVPGVPFPALHRVAHVKIGDLLREFGILKLSGEEAEALGLTRAFFPHGVGHFLGLQVHDVGGNQAGPAGGAVAPPADYPKLRTTRTLEEGNVFTIEPGLYFIEQLLKPHRSGKTSKHFDWNLIDRLAPLGGIRIEDDLVATKEGNVNLTRMFLP